MWQLIVVDNRNKTNIRVDLLVNKNMHCHSITRIGLILYKIDMKNKSDAINVIRVNPLETVSDNYLLCRQSRTYMYLIGLRPVLRDCTLALISSRISYFCACIGRRIVVESVHDVNDATMALPLIKLNGFAWDKAGAYPAYSHVL
jgi:hypothetical protein